MLLVLISMVSAECHPICNPINSSGQCNETLHGIYIAGAISPPGPCFNCGEVDGVCPSDFGEISCLVYDADCAYVEDGFWSENGVTKTNYVEFTPGDKTMHMIINSISTDEGKGVNFSIYGTQTGFDLLVRSGINTTVAGGKANATWSVSEADWEKSFVDESIDEFYFVAKVGGESDRISKSYGIYGTLKLNATYEDEEVVGSCGDYDNESACLADSEGLGSLIIIDPDPNNAGCALNVSRACVWAVSTCYMQNRNVTDPPLCGNNSVDITCDYTTEDKIGDCSTDQFFFVRYSSNNPSECPSWDTQPIPCPAKLRVPFFGIYSIVSVISIISLIYLMNFLIKREK